MLSGSADKNAVAGAQNQLQSTPEKASVTDGPGGQGASAGQAGTSSVQRAATAPAPRDKRLDKFSIPEIYNYDFDANPRPWNENGK